MLRTHTFSSEELEYFERCKEERLARDGRRKEAFAHFIESNSSLTLDSAGQKQLLLSFLGYIFGAQLKYLVETTIRSRPKNGGHLLPIPATEPITGEEVRAVIPQLMAKFVSKQTQIERKRENVRLLTHSDRQTGVFQFQERV